MLCLFIFTKVIPTMKIIVRGCEHDKFSWKILCENYGLLLQTVQGCLKVSYFWQMLGKNVKLWREEGNIKAVGEEYDMKEGKGEASNLHYNITAVRKIIRRKGAEILGDKIKIKKNGVGEEY